MHFWRSKSSLDSLKSVSINLGGNRRWVPLGGYNPIYVIWNEDDLNCGNTILNEDMGSNPVKVPTFLWLFYDCCVTFKPENARTYRKLLFCNWLRIPRGVRTANGFFGTFYSHLPSLPHLVNRRGNYRKRCFGLERFTGVKEKSLL